MEHTEDANKTAGAPSALNVGLASRIAELEDALRWYVENDDVAEGGHWEEENAFWLAGKRNAERLLANDKIEQPPTKPQEQTR